MVSVRSSLAIATIAAGGIAVALSSWAASPATADLTRLLAATDRYPVGGTDSPGVDKVLDAYQMTDPAWPLAAFISAEFLARAGKGILARSTYRRLAEWGADDARAGGWGGSGLATVALWRWLVALETDSPSSQVEVRKAVEVAQSLIGSRFTLGMYHAGELTSLPKLQEDIARRLASAAWAAGLSDLAQSLFLDYLAVASTATLTSAEQEIYNQAVANGWASQDRLYLLRGEHFFKITDYDTAKPFLNAASKSHNTQIRGEAVLFLAKISRRLNHTCQNRNNVIAMLDTVIDDSSDPDTVNATLLFRGELRVDALMMLKDFYQTWRLS